MVLFPLPLSPTSATISLALMVMLTSSTACRVLRDRLPPTLKCLVSPRVSSSGTRGSAVPPLTIGPPDVEIVMRVPRPRLRLAPLARPTGAAAFLDGATDNGSGRQRPDTDRASAQSTPAGRRDSGRGSGSRSVSGPE